MKLTEAQAWACIAESLEEREHERSQLAAYDTRKQHSICVHIHTLRHIFQIITPRTACVMRHRLRIFAPHADTSCKALYWDRLFKSSRERRILAAYFLYHMARNKEAL